MTEDLTKDQKEFDKLLSDSTIVIPKIFETVKGNVIAASKAEVKLDIGGVLIGVVRGPELYEEAEEYANLKPGDEVEATIVDKENENGELELSFRYAGQKKSWEDLRNAFQEKEVISVKVFEANKGGLLTKFRQIQGFLPVSQLAPENYPRVSGGDKTKILEKLKSFIGKSFDVHVLTLEEEEGRIIFSEKEVWTAKQKSILSKYKEGVVVNSIVTAVTDFGVFVNFGDDEDKKLEGLIHISELAWQRIENPSDIYKIGSEIKAEIIKIDGAKIFLSSKKLTEDPWKMAEKKYAVGNIVKGKVLKVNPFGLFVQLDDNIHGLAHISHLDLAPGQKIFDVFAVDTEVDFSVMSIEIEQHRLGLKIHKEESKKKDEKPTKKEEIKIEDKKEEKKVVKSEDKKEVKKNEKSDKEEKTKKKEAKKKKKE